MLPGPRIPRRSALEGYGAATYGDGFADVYDELYGDVSDVEGTVDLVSRLASGGRVLELGVGTGRLALPLATTGLEVWGVEASAAMRERLAAKPGGATVRVVPGDFAAVGTLPGLPGRFAVVLAAFNTLFNLGSEEAQIRCLAGVADRLEAGGCLVVEAFVPPFGPDDGPEGAVEPAAVDVGRVVLQVTRVDPRRQVIDGQRVTITEAGIRLRPWHLRYAGPAELDAMAARAGLALAERRAGWRDEPFDDGSERHVSVYRLAGRPGG